jgi:hypothetical protein
LGEARWGSGSFSFRSSPRFSPNISPQRSQRAQRANILSKTKPYHCPGSSGPSGMSAPQTGKYQGVLCVLCVLCGPTAMSGFRLAVSPVRPNPRPAGLYLNTIMMEPACRPFSVGRNGLNGPQHFSSPEARARCRRNEGRDGPAYAVYDDSRICPGEFANGPVNSADQITNDHSRPWRDDQ